MSDKYETELFGLIDSNECNACPQQKKTNNLFNIGTES